MKYGQDRMIIKVQNKVFLRPSLKNNLFAVNRLTVLRVGRYIGRIFFFYKLDGMGEILNMN